MKQSTREVTLHLPLPVSGKLKSDRNRSALKFISRGIRAGRVLLELGDTNNSSDGRSVARRRRLVASDIALVLGIRHATDAPCGGN